MGTWVRHNIITRLAAVIWWIFMLAVTIGLVGGWVQLVVKPTLLGAITMVFLTLVMGLPIAREGPNARRMGRMLVAGK